MFAHLPMYDVPANRPAHLRLWQAFQDLQPHAPKLSNAGDNLMADWLSTDLFLSQTCSLPFRARLHGLVQMVATPDNKISNCAPGYYHSVILARADNIPDLAANDFILAYNEPMSQSGWAAPQSIGITGASRLQTGGHAASAQALVDGRADVATIDALTWHFLSRDWDKASRLTILATTPATPTLPYITSLNQNASALKLSFTQAILSLDQEDRETLQIFGLVDIKVDKYLQLPLPPAP